MLLSSNRRTQHLPNPWDEKLNTWVRATLVCQIVIRNWRPPYLGLAESISWRVNWMPAVELNAPPALWKLSSSDWLLEITYSWVSLCISGLILFGKITAQTHSVGVLPSLRHLCAVCFHLTLWTETSREPNRWNFDFMMLCVNKKKSITVVMASFLTPLCRWKLGFFDRWQPFQHWEWRMKKDISETPSGSWAWRGPPVTAQRYSGSKGEIPVYPHAVDFFNGSLRC